ncbi:MAG: bifunctional aspartate kinase/homoserine dehydrogenase I [Treponema sp.]|nr:bifunctional aspartate kinase/homoserine dehydrogenase I [Treponema sp.]
MIVSKFGGTSVGSPAALEKVIELLMDPSRRSDTALVVVSAFSGITDSLIEMSRASASGDSSYLETAGVLKKRHLDMAAHFMAGKDLEALKEKIDLKIEELLKILEGAFILRELSNRTLDLVMSFGERLSASLISEIFCARGIPSIFLDTRELIKTTDDYGQAQLLEEESFTLIRSWFTSSPRGVTPLVVATGFIASAADGTTTTLGRGGSDFSAAIFGAALDVQEVEIWSDVDGILTADPRQVKNAFTVDTISYEEAMELSHFGAKVIYPPSIRPALERGIPIVIKNTFNPGGPGSRIIQNAGSGSYSIRGISSMGPVTLIRLQGPAMVGVAGFSSRLFGSLARRKISIILITQSSSEYSICFAVHPADAEEAEAAIAEEFEREMYRAEIDPPISETNLSIVAVVGAGMKSSSGISGKVFQALGRNGVNVVAIAQGSSEINISAVISSADENKALNAIHEAFFLDGTRSVNLFLVGIGLIGGTLVEQIAAQRDNLASQHKIRINLVGAADFGRMIFDPQGLDLLKIRDQLKEGQGEALDLNQFVQTIADLNLPNSAFCDCTASDQVSLMYEACLSKAIPVITPNKRANSGSLDYYRKLRAISGDRNIPYLYECTVGAGLPVISTLRDLSLSGDRIRRIEAVVSGTLSFIFNNYDGTKPFSALVREAKDKGYTEPDPRDDLNAMDAARKALILARECGMALEFASVQIDPILPPACFEAPDVEQFFVELEKIDQSFEDRRSRSALEGKALRYVAVIEENSARLSLREEPANSPFRGLVDSDNMVVITTDRYSTLPMVIKGPGAGAQVTAGGIFADIVRIARTLV